MRHRQALLCTITLASRFGGFAAAAFLRAGQVRRVGEMHHQIFKMGRNRLLSLSTRAAFACTGTVHLSQQQQGFDSRWLSSSSKRTFEMGAGRWCPSREPALAMSAAAPGGGGNGIRRSLASAPLRFRGGATTDGESLFGLGIARTLNREIRDQSWAALQSLLLLRFLLCCRFAATEASVQHTRLGHDEVWSTM